MTLKISIITLFPENFGPVLNSSILKRAQNKGKIQFELINLRNFGEGIHKQSLKGNLQGELSRSPYQVVDGRPYSGGAGMVLRPDVLAKAVNSIKKPDSHIILTTASGTTYKQARAQELSKLEHIIIVCGHYEGVDQRFIDNYVNEEISIGDYVLTGGEIPAMIIADSVTRLIPGVLEKADATVNESFSEEFPLEYPQYTRPDEFEGIKVPEVLTSGNHSEIAKWKKEKSLEKTKKVRPDLLKNIS